jgi:hypothetical protein
MDHDALTCVPIKLSSVLRYYGRHTACGQTRGRCFQKTSQIGTQKGPPQQNLTAFERVFHCLQISQLPDSLVYNSDALPHCVTTNLGSPTFLHEGFLCSTPNSRDTWLYLALAGHRSRRTYAGVNHRASQARSGTFQEDLDHISRGRD